MAEASVRRRYLLITNGSGEDTIAAAIVARLPAGIDAEAYPMVGAGTAFADVCRIVGPRSFPAAEGWRTVRGSLRRNLASGALGSIPPALSFLRRIAGKYDRVIVVGDLAGVLAAMAGGYRNLIYLDIHKTGAARLYSGPERWAIKRSCETVFCRAETLARTLTHIGVDARAPGTIMMDAIPKGQYDAASRRSKPLAVTLLPGSRALTAESFALQVDALRTLPPALRPDCFVAVAGSVTVDELARTTGLRRTPMLSAEPDDLGQLSDGHLTIHMARGRALGNLLVASDVVLSQAGTATIQALGLGRPAITFTNPRDRRARFADEQQLFGAARHVVAPDPAAIGAALKILLEDPAERARRATLGRQRIGPPGAMQAVVDRLVEA